MIGLISGNTQTDTHRHKKENFFLLGACHIFLYTENHGFSLLCVKFWAVIYKYSHKFPKWSLKKPNQTIEHVLFTQALNNYFIYIRLSCVHFKIDALQRPLHLEIEHSELSWEACSRVLKPLEPHVNSFMWMWEPNGCYRAPRRAVCSSNLKWRGVFCDQHDSRSLWACVLFL